ncbi:MAG: hypothetical protein WC821_05225 [archaeon]|jgi:hypothetical protein
MSFEREIWLVEVVILLILPFNPTNIFADAISGTIINYLLDPNGVFGWVGISLAIAMKIILAVAEVELINTTYKKLRK